MRIPDHLEHDFLGHLLNRTGQIHLALSDRRLRLARRSTKQLFECRPRHAKALRIREVLLVHSQRPVISKIDEVFLDERDVARLAIRGEFHDLVLAAVDPKPSEIGKRAVQQAQRIRKPELFEQRHLVSSTDSDGAGRPLTNTVNRHDGGLLERGRVEG